MGAIHKRQDLNGHGGNRASAVVIDAYPLWLDAVEAVLRGLGLPTLGKATSPADGLALVAEHRPDIVVTDIDFGPGHLASAIRQIFEHSIVFAPPSAVSTAARRLGSGSPGHAPAPAERPNRDEPTALGAHLTRREREILTHVSEGMANAEIARQLWVSEQTVKFHLSNIYRKLNVTNRTQASRWARIGRVDEEPSHRAVGS